MADYIDRERLTFHLAQEIEFFGEVNIKHDPCAYGDMLGLKRALSYVNALPTADVVEVKHGEWEKRTFIIFDGEKVGYRCSECNTTWDTETNYCPNCGAEMGGKKALKERERE